MYYFVYLLTNSRNTVLYVGVTNNLERRSIEHLSGRGSKFTKKYNLSKLVYYEIFLEPLRAIEREKQIKKFRREKKDKLISDFNAEWKDLYQKFSS